MTDKKDKEDVVCRESPNGDRKGKVWRS